MPCTAVITITPTPSIAYNRKTSHATLSEQWTVIGAYLYFLKKTGRLQTGTDRFSVGKYLNETAASAHDKKGDNINVIIGEMLVYLVKNRDKYIDRVEAVRKLYLQIPQRQRHSPGPLVYPHPVYVAPCQFPSRRAGPACSETKSTTWNGIPSIWEIVSLSRSFLSGICWKMILEQLEQKVA